MIKQIEFENTVNLYIHLLGEVEECIQKRKFNDAKNIINTLKRKMSKFIYE